MTRLLKGVLKICDRMSVRILRSKRDHASRGCTASVGIRGGAHVLFVSTLSSCEKVMLVLLLLLLTMWVVESGLHETGGRVEPGINARMS